MKSARRVPAHLRTAAILTELRNKGHASVNDLSEWLGVSDMTIRRDLDQLESEGVIERTHGGAHIPGAFKDRALKLLEPSLEHRSQSAQLEKKRIARTAIELISSDLSIAFDIGTSVFELAALIEPPAPWIMTGSLPIQRVLTDHKVRVAVPPGTLGGREPAISGASTVAYLQNYIFDIAFLGVAGLTPEGLFDYSPEDSEIKKVLVQKARKRIVLADHTKFGTLSTIRFATLADVDLLITDRMPPDDLSVSLRDAGIEIRVADA